MKSKVQHRIHNSPPLDPIPSQMNPVHNLFSSLFLILYIHIYF
jgi:hypothetical protein